MRKLIRGLVLLVILLVAGVAAWLALAPPDLLLVADSYSAKIVCSNRFLAGRDPKQVLAVDVQAPGNPLLKFVTVDVDEAEKTVTAHMFGFFALGQSIYRDGLGCTSLPAGYDAASLAALPGGPAPLPRPGAGAWPDGNDPAETDPALQAALGDASLQGPGMRAILVLHDGRIIGETYGPGFDRETPLLGWSMTKTVNAAIAGRLMQEGKLGLDDQHLLPEWDGDSRREIHLRDLTGMESGLRFNEDYGDVSDVTRMLFLQPDMAGFTAGQTQDAGPGTKFNYSTGTSVVIARIWMNRLADPAMAVSYPSKALFGPLGMASATLETDVAGTFVGGSYLYATARDWGRFAQMLLQDGVWKGETLLGPDFIKAIHTPSRASNGAYSQAQTWFEGPGDQPNSAFSLPQDTIWMQGHDGQSIAIIPSRKLVVLRMGLTPEKLGYLPQQLVKAVVDTVR
nr:serine hydrolase [uncultured Gellertiella sp.]